MENTRTRSLAAAAPAIPFPVRVLRRLRPLVAALLGSPLHGLLSRDVLLLGYAGRRSGRRYVLPLSYVEVGGALYLCTRPEGSDWWRNLRGGADVDLVWRGRAGRARASVLARDDEEAVDGLRAFLTRNPGTGRLLYHVENEGGLPREQDLRREVLRSVVVRLDRAGGPGAAAPSRAEAGAVPSV